MNLEKFKVEELERRAYRPTGEIPLITHYLDEITIVSTLKNLDEKTFSLVLKFDNKDNAISYFQKVIEEIQHYQTDEETP